MRHICILLLTSLSITSVWAQTNEDLNEGLRIESASVSGNYVMKWFGKSGRTYFIQTSTNLMPDTWGYVPVLESGTGSLIQWAFSSTAQYSFVRLIYTDATFTGSASDADFDGDGLNNWTELNTHESDPFSNDTDSDGLPDGWEVQYGLNPVSNLGIYGGFGDLDQDGISNLEEYNLGRNPSNSAPEIIGDQDMDGVPDYRDSVQYDPLFKHAPTGKPRYVVVNLGPCTTYLDMSDNGTLVWERASASGGNRYLSLWSPKSPLRQDITLTSAHKPSGSVSFTPNRILDDGRLFGPGKETSLVARVGIFDPSTGASLWLPAFDPEPGTSLYDLEIKDCRAGPGFEIFSSLEYTTRTGTPAVYQDWVAFGRSSTSGSSVEAKSVTSGSGGPHLRTLVPSSASSSNMGALRVKQSGTIYRHEVATSSGAVTLESYDTSTDPWTFEFKSISPEPNSWIIGRRRSAINTGLVGDVVYVPETNLGTWLRRPIFRSSSDYTQNIEIEVMALASSQRQVITSSGIWADGNFESFSVGSPSWSGTGITDISKSGIIAGRVSSNLQLAVPVDFGIASEDIIVPADVAQVELPTYFEGIEEHVLGARLQWQIVQGTGGSLSQTTSELAVDDEHDTDTMLTTSTTVNATYQVEAKITELKIGDAAQPTAAAWLPSDLRTRSGTVRVGPGEASSFVLAYQPTGLVADQKTLSVVSVNIKDAYGNAVGEGVPAFWRLKGDASIITETSSTGPTGNCYAIVRAGRVPGPITVILEVDELRQEFIIPQQAVSVNLATGGVQTEWIGSQEFRTFNATVTSNALVTPGTPVRWSTTQGMITASQTELQSNKTAVATIKVPVTSGAGGAPVVVTASVCEAVGIASVDLAPVTVSLAQAEIVPDDASELTVSAPELAGRGVKIRAQRTKLSFNDYDVNDLADGVVSNSPQPSAEEFGAEMTWTRPTETEAPDFNGAVLLQSSVFTLGVNASGQPTLVLNPDAPLPTTLVLTDSAASVSPGDSTSIYWNIEEGTRMSLSCNGCKVETLLSAPPQSGSSHVVPTGSLALVTNVKLRSRIDSTAPPSATDVRPVKLNESNDEITLTMPSTGVVAVDVTVPDDQITEDSDRLKLVVETVESENPEQQDYSQSHTVFIVPSSAPAQQDPISIAAASAEMWTNMSFSNRPATAAELAELDRHAHAAAAQAAASGFQTDLEELSPPAFGGDLTHQAMQGKNFLAMAKLIDSAATDIEVLARKMDELPVVDDSGKKLFQMDMGITGRAAMLLGRTSFRQWLESGRVLMAATLNAARNTALTATVEAFQSTMSWTHSTLVAAKLDNLPLIRDADKIVQQLTEEGLVDYMKALSRLTTAITENPQAAGMHLFTHLEGVVQPPLDSWAASGGDTERIATAGAGMLAYGVQTGTLIASSACDNAAVRRMVGTALGTIISAALGSTAAQEELKEMIPFWSWLVMGPQVAERWEAGQYYGSGKKAGELIVQVAGDLTIFIPVVKGAQIAIKSLNGVTAASIRQSLSRVNYQFTRKKQADPVGADETITHCLKHAADEIGCFPAGTGVLMADGAWRAIETLKAGELVMADDPRDSQPPAPRRVLDVLENRTEQLCDVQTAGGSVTATSEHPFWVQGSGWKAAADLVAGMALTSPDSNNVTVSSANLRPAVCATWNLTVADSHSFYVKCGESPVLVHNTKPGARVYVVYQVPLPSGKYYVGRCSLPWDGVSDLDQATKNALDRRFARHHRASIHPGFARNRARAIWKEIYDANDYSKKQQIYGTMRGVEHRLEERWAAQGKSANRDTPGWKKPIADTNPNRTTYLNKADTRGKLICPKR